VGTCTDIPMSIGAVARRLGCQTWQLRRLIQAGLLAEPVRVGISRAWMASELPKIEQALRARGYLPRNENGT
jgi:DNA-binding transcriptional MerR regulator